MNASNDSSEFPYGGTSGHSGSSTSRDRALSDDRSGRTMRRQALALTLLTKAGADGMTVAEYRDRPELDHHGSASGSLSNLHKKGKIARLAFSRSGCRIYVMPDYVLGRATEAQGTRPLKNGGTSAKKKGPAGPAECGCVEATCVEHDHAYAIDENSPRTHREDA